MKVRSSTGVLFGALLLISVQQLMLWRSMGGAPPIERAPGASYSAFIETTHASSGRKLLQLQSPGELDLQAAVAASTHPNMPARRLRQVEREALSRRRLRTLETETLHNASNAHGAQSTGTRGLRALEEETLHNASNARGAEYSTSRGLRALETETLHNTSHAHSAASTGTRGLRALETETLLNTSNAHSAVPINTRGLRALETETLHNASTAHNTETNTSLGLISLETETLHNTSHAPSNESITGRRLRALENETLHNASHAPSAESSQGRRLLQAQGDSEDASSYKMLAYVLIGCRGDLPEPSPVAAAAAMKEETNKVPEFAPYAELRKNAIDEALAMVLETPITHYGCKEASAVFAGEGMALT